MISIHALREEGDGSSAAEGSEQIQFLSTPSARRATFTVPVHGQPEYISIHALREEGDHWLSSLSARRWRISIHALREEGDWYRTEVAPC